MKVLMSLKVFTATAIAALALLAPTAASAAETEVDPACITCWDHSE